ncbi:dihydrolipoamide acetyltransferase family protein [Streptomyces sp. NPDC051105]|uniref:dihydrolipoamide acetyltransferase family protein n=1 Tax=Streptomyces sp. NPDC051105 TaxID=3154843 RepID=UPI003424E063
MISVPDFRLPDLGEGLMDAEIVQWLVSQGDVIEIDQSVVEVETAKAMVVVPTPFAGTVTALHGGAGDRVAVGDVLLSVAAAREAESAPAAVTATTETGSGNVLVGYGTGTPSRRPRRLPRKPTAPAGAVTPTPSVSVQVTSPVVRRLADENGVDLRRVAGTGPGGVVRRVDVLNAIQTAPRPTPPEPAGSGTGQRIPLRGVHKAMADVLTRSRREIPEATVWVDVDATNLLAARRQLAQHAGESVSILALLARFAVLGLRRFPALNARVEGDEIVVLDRIHLGFAAQTDRGLVVPVVRDGHSLTTRQLSNALHRMTGLAREGKLPPAELGGGSFTINNYGVFGVDGSAAIINHPEVAILGFGRVIERPWIVAGQVTARHVGQLTLAFDHRVCDGGTAGGFLRFVADCVENPVVALADT